MDDDLDAVDNLNSCRSGKLEYTWEEVADRVDLLINDEKFTADAEAAE